MKYFTTILFAILISTICTTLSAQEKSIEVSVNVENVNGEEQRNIVITIGEGNSSKEIKWSDNGQIPEEIKSQLEKEGIDIEMLEGDGQVEVTVESSDEVEKEVEIIKIIGDGEEGEHIQDSKIDMDDDTEIMIIKIKGNQEIPEDVKKLLEEHDIDIEELKKEGLHEAKDHDVKVIKKKAIKIKTKDEDGNEAIFEWDGEGDGDAMPEDIQKLLKEEGIDLDGEHKMIFIGDGGDKQEIKVNKKTKKQYRIKTKDENGNEKIIEWNGEGEMPAEMKEHHDGAKKKVRIIKKKQSSKSNRAQLGVMIEDHEQGVKVIEVIKGTPADRIAMKVGAIITKADGKKIKEVDDLLAAIRPFAPGETIKIDYMEHDTYYADVEVHLSKAEDQPNYFVFKDVPNVNIRTFSLLNGVAHCDTTDTKSTKIESKLLKEATPVNQATIKNIADERKLKLKSFSTYPNPTSGMVNINFEGNNEPTVIQITDITGKEIFKDTINNFNGSYNKDIDLGNYAKGQFILYVIQNQKVFTESIILQ